MPSDLLTLERDFGCLTRKQGAIEWVGPRKEPPGFLNLLLMYCFAPILFLGYTVYLFALGLFFGTLYLCFSMNGLLSPLWRSCYSQLEDEMYSAYKECSWKHWTGALREFLIPIGSRDLILGALKVANASQFGDMMAMGKYMATSDKSTVLLIKTEDFLSLRSWKDASKLTRICGETNWKDALFVSHKWLETGLPDDESMSKLKQIQAAAMTHNLPYIFIDFLCTFQDRLDVRSISWAIRLVCAKSTMLVIERSGYQSSAWCQLERLSNTKEEYKDEYLFVNKEDAKIVVDLLDNLGYSSLISKLRVRKSGPLATTNNNNE